MSKRLTVKHNLQAALSVIEALINNPGYNQQLPQLLELQTLLKDSISEIENFSKDDKMKDDDGWMNKRFFDKTAKILNLVLKVINVYDHFFK